jgi:hypothetical protein
MLSARSRSCASVGSATTKLPPCTLPARSPPQTRTRPPPSPLFAPRQVALRPRHATIAGALQPRSRPVAPACRRPRGGTPHLGTALRLYREMEMQHRLEQAEAAAEGVLETIAMRQQSARRVYQPRTDARQTLITSIAACQQGYGAPSMPTSTSSSDFTVAQHTSKLSLLRHVDRLLLGGAG